MTGSAQAEGRSVLRDNIATIDSTNPLVIGSGNAHHIMPRLDRLEAKIAYLVEYITYLEARLERAESGARDEAGGQRQGF